MKILLTGASGYVGAKIHQDLIQNGYNVYGTYLNNEPTEKGIKVDLTKRADVNNVIAKIRPDVILHVAADAHSKTCEANPIHANLINVEATRFLVDNAKKHNIRFIQLSTFACFNPSNTYGKTKLQAEKIVSTLNNYIILRASLIIGISPNHTSENFFNTLLASIRNNHSIEADTSWKFEVTCLSHLSRVIRAVLANPDLNNIIIPIVAKGITSRYKIATDLLTRFNIETKSINQNRNIPLPTFNRAILKENDLPETTYEQCIKEIANEITQF